jgi:RNA polymerase sigma factor (sigma-70 family)
MSSIYKTEAEIIAGCKANNRDAQKALYKSYIGIMNAVCYRYTKSYDDAKDIVHDSFMIIFEKIGTFSGSGSLGGWIRKIVVNNSIDYIKRNKTQSLELSDNEYENQYNTSAYSNYTEVENNNTPSDYDITALNLSKEEILEGISLLQENYRIVFNMFVIDGYSHKSIAETLQISEETSRIRLKRSRSILQKLLLEMAQKTKLS